MMSCALQCPQCKCSGFGAAPVLPLSSMLQCPRQAMYSAGIQQEVDIFEGALQCLLAYSMTAALSPVVLGFLGF